MELFCLCCMEEIKLSCRLDTFCEFQPEECQDDILPTIILFSEVYFQLTQLPPIVNELNTLSSQLPSYDLCSECALILKNFYLFRLRARKCHEELQTKVNIAKIINHLRSERIEENSEQDEDVTGSIIPRMTSNDYPNGLFSCTVCGKRFQKHKLLIRHENIHLQRKSHHCQYCKKGFVTRVSCNNHELKVHRKNIKHPHQIPSKIRYQQDGHLRLIQTSSPLSVSNEAVTLERKHYVCDLCPKVFTRQSSLNDHKMVLHAGIRQHSCYICNREFAKEDSLKTHLALHLGKNHRCKLCGKAFAKISFLRRHLEGHESSDNIRRYACSICSKRFTAKSHLTDHELIHGDKRPHKCNICGDSFRQKQQLKIHNYQHVGKPFCCGECKADYSSRARLRAHVEKHHRKVDRAERDGKMVQPDAALQVHMEKHHRKVDQAEEDGKMVQPDFGDKIVNEELLNEICYQIDSNPIILQNLEDDGVNLICTSSEQLVFLADDRGNMLPEMIDQCL